MRILYLDESGIGKIEQDPLLVVAGVIIHADTQWGELARRLDALLSDATPFGVKKPNHLHAKDIFHGSGEFHRDKWDQGRRNKLLEDTGALVSEFKLPVVWTAVERKEYAARYPVRDKLDCLRGCYSVAAVGCFMQAEMFMRQSHLDGEVCSILMEENRDLQKHIPEYYRFLVDPGDETKNLLAGWEEVMPLRKLIDTPACQPKTASSILQLADYCAFAIKRRMENKSGSKQLTNPISDNLLRYVDPGKKVKGHFWNPVHMPSKWPFPVVIENRQFKRTDTGEIV